jgi:tRNA(fMet)-specific endonuclease VapC
LADYLLDTTVIIDYFRDREEAVAYLESILNGEASGAFSVITEAELWEGLRSGEEEKHEAILLLLERIKVGMTIARRAGELRRAFREQGLGMADALIAATAEAIDARLVTRNAKHYQALQQIIACEFYESP